MTRRPITLLATAATIPLTAVTLAACGGGGAATASPPPAPTHAKRARTTTVRVADSSLGRILVNSQGRTLYLFKADSRTMSACSGACAVAWPPLVATGKPAAGAGVTASKLGTITRSGGSKQVTYDGHPLYLFIKDQKPGQTAGQGVTAFGAAWFALSPAGTQIPSKAPKTVSTPGPAAPTSPPAAKPQPAPKPAPPVAKPPAPKPPPVAKPAPPVAKPAAPANNGIPQNNGGDGDADNNGGPSDGDGNV